MRAWICSLKPVPPQMVVGFMVERPVAHVTQVELGTVPVVHWTLVHVSRLLVAVGFQWSAHDQPGTEKMISKDAPSWQRMESGEEGGRKSWRSSRVQTLQLRPLSPRERDSGHSA